MGDIEKIKREAVNNDLFVYHSCIVTKYNENKGTREEPLVITQSYIQLVGKKDPNRRGYWLDLRNISMNDSRIDLLFNKNDLRIQFTSQEIDLIKDKIFCILSRILSPTDKQFLGFDRFKPKLYLPTPQSIYARFRTLAYLFNIQYERKLFGRVQNIFSELLDTLYFYSQGQEGEQTLSGVFCPIINATEASDIENVMILGPPDTDYMKYMEGTFKRKDNLRHVLFTGPLTASFEKMASQITDSGLTGLSFTQSAFNNDQFSLLLEKCSEKTDFNSLSLQNAVEKNLIYDKLLNSSLISRLTMLNLDTTEGLDLPKIFDKLKTIKSLSLSYTKMDIGDILDSINSAKLTNLEMLCVSGNLCKALKFKLPKTLKRIDCERVLWSDGSFAAFLKAVCSEQWKSGLDLRCSFAQNTNGIEKIFTKINGHHLISLHWTGNPISDQMSVFLKTCDNLKEFVANISFDSSNLESFEKIGTVLGKLKYLELVSVAGDPAKPVGSRSAKKFLSNLSKSKSLKKLNIAYQDIGKEGADEIVNMSKNAPLEYVFFDGIRFSIADYQSFADSVKDLNRYFDIVWPNADLRSVNQSSPEVKKLEDTLWPNQKFSVKKDEQPMFEDPMKPSYIHRTWHEPEYFPLYVDSNVQSIFKRSSLQSDNEMESTDGDSDSYSQKPKKTSIKPKSNTKGKTKPRPKPISDSDSDSETDSDSLRNGRESETETYTETESSDDLNRKRRGSRRMKEKHNPKIKTKTKAKAKSESDTESSDSFVIAKRKSISSPKRRVLSNSSYDEVKPMIRKSSSDSSDVIPPAKLRKAPRRPSPSDVSDSDSDSYQTTNRNKPVKKADPPRRKKEKEQPKQKSNRRKRDSSSDEIPPRKDRHRKELSDDDVPVRRDRRKNERDSPDNELKKKRTFKRPTWDFPFEPIDDVDDSVIIQELQAKFSLKNLCSYVFSK